MDIKKYKYNNHSIFVYFDLDSIQAFKRARNNCNGKIREAKRKHYRNLMEENKENPRKFWDTIKTIFPTNKKSSLPRMEKSKCKELANTFSEYFSEAVTKLKKNAISLSNIYGNRIPSRE